MYLFRFNTYKDVDPDDYLDKCKILRSELRKNKKFYDVVNIRKGKYRNEDITSYEARIPILNIILREGCHKGKDPEV